jgi:hypothetical protein
MGGNILFKVTNTALGIINKAISSEKLHENEKLYVRLTMGIG